MSGRNKGEEEEEAARDRHTFPLLFHADAKTKFILYFIDITPNTRSTLHLMRFTFSMRPLKLNGNVLRFCFASSRLVLRFVGFYFWIDKWKWIALTGDFIFVFSFMDAASFGLERRVWSSPESGNEIRKYDFRWWATMRTNNTITWRKGKKIEIESYLHFLSVKTTKFIMIFSLALRPHRLVSSRPHEEIRRNAAAQESHATPEEICLCLRLVCLYEINQRLSGN